MNRRVFYILLQVVIILPAIFAVSTVHADIPIVNVELTTSLGDKQVYRAGDRISLLVSLDRDAYLLVIYQDAEYNRHQIVPSEYQPDNFYRSGFYFPLFDQRSAFEVVVSAPYGQETVWVYALTAPFPGIIKTVSTDVLPQVHLTHRELQQQLREYAAEHGLGLGFNHLDILTHSE